jgi:hypothetical protein
MTAQAAITCTHPAPGGSPVPALLAIVPHLLGFGPRSSVVVIGTEQPRGLVKVTLRYDLPDPADPGLAAETAEHAFAVLSSQRLAGAIAVGYGPDALVRPVAAAFSELAENGPIGLLEFLRADEGRYWSYVCASEDCCPAAGTPFDAAAHPAPAAITADGEVFSSRDAAAATIAPLSGGVAGSMRQATLQAEQNLTRILDRVRRTGRAAAARKAVAAEGLAAVEDMIAAYRAGRRFKTLYQVAWLTVALKDLRVRDDACARMDPRHHQAHQRMWTDVVRRARVAAGAHGMAGGQRRSPTWRWTGRWPRTLVTRWRCCCAR